MPLAEGSNCAAREKTFVADSAKRTSEGRTRRHPTRSRAIRSPEYGLPVGIKVVSAEEWKIELLRQNILDRDARNPRARFMELRHALAARKKIGCRDNHVWTVRPT
jgi:hypothetical protein